MNKKSFIGIIIGILVGILIIGLIYFFFFSTTTDQSGNQTSRNPFASFFGDAETPVDDQIIDDSPNFDNLPDLPVEDGVVLIPKLRNLSNEPISGYTSFIRRATSTTTTTEAAVRYMNVYAGHIFDTSDRTLESTRISNTTYPKTYESFFFGSSTVVARIYDDVIGSIDTFLGSLEKSNSTSTTDTEFILKGTFLNKNIATVVVSNTKLFNFYKSNSGGTGYVQTPQRNGVSKEVRVYDTPFSSWNFEWINNDVINALTKSSGGELGYMFSVNTVTGAQNQILGPISGLVAKSNSDQSGVVYNRILTGTIETFYRNIKDGTIIQLLSNTIVDKCVWSKSVKTTLYCAVPESFPRATYPDDWYKGKITFSDAIVRIDMDKITETRIVNLRDVSGVSIDATNLTLSPTEDYLYFVNKTDSNLWSLEVK